MDLFSLRESNSQRSKRHAIPKIFAFKSNRTLEETFFKLLVIVLGFLFL